MSRVLGASSGSSIIIIFIIIIIINIIITSQLLVARRGCGHEVLMAKDHALSSIKLWNR